MNQLVAAITDGNVDRTDVIILDSRAKRLTNIGLDTISSAGAENAPQ
jgi:hypothetical protein